MRVAFDAGFLGLPPSGIGVYVQELIAALPNAARRDCLSLDMQLLYPAVSDGTMPPLQRLGWETTGVELAARRLRPLPDVVHVPHQYLPLAVPLDGASRRIPYVATVHDVIPQVLPEYRQRLGARVRHLLTRRNIHRARVVLVPSQATASDVEAVLGVPAEKIRVVPLAASPHYRPAATHEERHRVRCDVAPLGIETPYVFNVGGFDARKNLPLLIEAFAAALPRIEPIVGPVSLVIAGAPHSDNPTIFPPLEPVIHRFGLANRVKVVGRVRPREKLALYQGASAYCTPSSYEGFGLTALEAMACGVPTIVSDRTSLPEVVGDAGVVVPPTVEAVAEAITRVLTEPSYAADLRERALKRAAEFSWERTASQTLAAYREASEG